MQTFLLVTTARRGGECFTLKTPRQEIIGTMRLNAQKGRHEMELTQEQFLKYAKDLSTLCAIPGCATYVAEIRGSVVNPGFLDGRTFTDDSRNGPFDNPEPFTSRSKTASGVIAETDGLNKLPFFSLKKIAADEVISIEGIKGVKAIRQHIRDSRLKKSA